MIPDGGPRDCSSTHLGHVYLTFEPSSTLEAAEPTNLIIYDSSPSDSTAGLLTH